MFPEALIAYQGHSMLLTNIHGHMREELHGFYHHKTRFLSRFHVRLDGRDPHFVSANLVDAHSMIGYYLAPVAPVIGPDGRPQPQDEIEQKGLELQVNRFVGGGLHQDLVLTNHTLRAVTVELSVEVSADYHDICAPPWWDRAPDETQVITSWHDTPDGGELRLRLAIDELPHETIVHFPTVGAKPRYEGDRVVYRLTLPPETPVDLCVPVHLKFLGEAVTPDHECHAFLESEALGHQARQQWLEGISELCGAPPLVQDAWGRAVCDLASLALLSGEGHQRYTPAAGIPIYQALFGRDTLTTAWQSSLLSADMLKGVIETIAQRLGTKYDDWRDEQPGRVIHQQQWSPSALLQLTPYSGYYGDYAGPGLFLMAIGRYFEMTGDRAFVRRHHDAILNVLDWMDRDGDLDGDGFYEYDTQAGDRGTKNQGWKDSPEAFVYEDGRQAPNPLAAAEIQGYYYAAKQAMAALFGALGDEARARDLAAQAAELKRRFNQAFWMPDAHFYALALGPEKAQLKSIASNAGHCLAAGIVDADKAEATVRRLMAPDMFSGWGIRTLSSEHPAYNPFAYHLGTVWPSENGTIAWGFKRYGFDSALHALARGLFDATLLFDQRRLPEALGGHPRDDRHPHPGIYPRSCAPQAWSASAMIQLVQAMLGLRWDAQRHALLLDPSLPAWLPELVLADVPVGPAKATLRVSRDGSGATDVQVLSSQGRPQVLIEPMTPASSEPQTEDAA
jgi:glycogen debranching enzyme